MNTSQLECDKPVFRGSEGVLLRRLAPVALHRTEYLQIQLTKKLLDTYIMMRGNALKNTRQRLYLDWIMYWDYFVVFTINLRCDSHMRASPSHSFVTQALK